MRISDWSSDVCSSDLRLDEHGVLAWRPVALAGDQFEEMTVQVDRVAHHRIVDEVHPHPFALQKRDRFVMIRHLRSEEHTPELQSLMRISYADFRLTNKQRQIDRPAARRQPGGDHPARQSDMYH